MMSKERLLSLDAFRGVTIGVIAVMYALAWVMGKKRWFVKV